MAKRGNKASQDNATAAPALRLSPNFQSSSADIELRSKDGVRFLVHKANLSTASTVFADMFESSTSGDQERPSIELEESAEILERLLGYCYPRVNPVWNFEVEDDREFVRAIDKYHVPRAIEAGQTSLQLRFRGTDWPRRWTNSSPGFQTAFIAFSFASHFGLEELAALAFPHLLYDAGHLSFNSDVKWMLSADCPDGLSSTDKLRLVSWSPRPFL
ncbi:hypothetical protein BCR35DRAFT_110031 [Leucosporidium creatinivorum]|uniref:BTB domain-containing protein n=1 Tax=Leucosporidium creatinivorum TaxID=106004 RepID=A0A1Y2G3P2_9BASI|nr:hypothetical protein BCR35DRAFT_110031 [Leucosporidium creatinivorum]